MPKRKHPPAEGSKSSSQGPTVQQPHPNKKRKLKQSQHEIHTTEKLPPRDFTLKTTDASAIPKPLPPPRRPKINKLAPARTFPKIPPESNATGPYSSRTDEGKNMLGVTRQQDLASYLKRCMDLIMLDGFRTIHLSAMGAAIAHAFLLTTSLPVALVPTFARADIKTSIITGTVQCVDEIIPDEEDEDEDEGGMQIRQKSCVNIIITLGDGVKVEGIRTIKKKGSRAAKAAGIASSTATTKGTPVPKN